jgi:acyl-CoA synthetase (AMP-forming)/AMP-acid ligase II
LEQEGQSTPDITCSQTLVELLLKRAAQKPQQVAYTFLVDGETQKQQLTYQDLDRRARAIGAYIQSLCLPGERVLLVYPPGLDYICAFFGCLYAGVVAVPTYPPRPNRSLERWQGLLENSGASAALTTASLGASLEAQSQQNGFRQRLKWTIADWVSDRWSRQWRMPHVNPQTLAFLQYTSGSTAAPKGVMITHHNLLHNLSQIYRGFEHNDSSRVVSWLPMYHDMGLIGGVLQPLYAGVPATLMSPLMFLQKPVRWLRAISEWGATSSGGPNFAYDLCTRQITPQQKAELDLSGWRVAFNGAEPISAQVLSEFAAAFAECGFRPEAFYPCYGLAESTLFVSGGVPSQAPKLKHVETQTWVSCGRPFPDQQVAIVDPETGGVCAPGEVGEIWLSSPSVARGYWQQPQETQSTFAAHSSVGDRGFLRTGDLGFLEAGELYVTGRLKDVMIIRGSNYYPQDIEWTVERSHSGIRASCVASFSISVQEEEKVVVLAEVDRAYRSARSQPEPSVSDLLDSIVRTVVRQHDLPLYQVVLLQPGALPKTSSGKIQRRACRKAFLDGSLAAVTIASFPHGEKVEGMKGIL